MLAINGVDHINMNVSNLKDSVKFYEKLFNNTEVKEAGSNGFGKPYAILGLDGKLFLCLYENDFSGKDAGPLNHIGIHVQDFKNVVSSLKEEGHQLLYGGIVDYPKSQSVYIADPDGNEIEFSSHFGGGL